MRLTENSIYTMVTGLLATIVILILASCDKIDQEPDPPISGDTCSEYPGSYDFLVQWTHPQYGFRSPSFNPGNPNEFAYVKYTYGQLYGMQLRKHNLATGQDVLIKDIEYDGYRISWGSNGWIVLCQKLYEVWKVRDDGSEMVQINTANSSFHPIWNSNADRILYSRFTQGGIRIYVMDEVGNELDSFPHYYQNYAWYSGNKVIVWSDDEAYRIYDTDTKIIETEGQLPDDIGSLYPMPIEGLFAYLSMEGSINVVNITTGTVKPIVRSCGRRYSYEQPILGTSPNTTTILAQRQFIDSLGPMEYYAHHNIIRIHADGVGVDVIDLLQ